MTQQIDNKMKLQANDKSSHITEVDYYESDQL